MLIKHTNFQKNLCILKTQSMMNPYEYFLIIYLTKQLM